MREIERKFLVRKNALEIIKTLALRKEDIMQGYVDVDSKDISQIRYRITNYKYLHEATGLFTLKLGEGISRTEINVPMNVFDTSKAIKEACSKIIEKVRYTIMIRGVYWYLDIFPDGSHIFEVELESEDQEIYIPKWVLKEVTDEKALHSYHKARKKI